MHIDLMEPCSSPRSWSIGLRVRPALFVLVRPALQMAKRADLNGPARAQYKKARSENGPARSASCPCWKPHTTARHGHDTLQQAARPRPAPSARSSAWPPISYRYEAGYIRRGRNPSYTVLISSPRRSLSCLSSLHR